MHRISASWVHASWTPVLRIKRLMLEKLRMLQLFLVYHFIAIFVQLQAI